MSLQAVLGDACAVPTQSEDLLSFISWTFLVEQKKIEKPNTQLYIESVSLVGLPFCQIMQPSVI